MTASAMEDKRWRLSHNKKLEGDEDNLRTIECLRGRLLAERQASKAAKDDAELMGNKLIELENKLREETKLRKKAEKKLNFLKRKLLSLNISLTLEGSEQSSSSENCGFSCTSSTSTSGTIDPEKSQPKSQSTIPGVSQDINDNALETKASNQTYSGLPFEESSSTQDNSNSDHNFKDYLLDKSSYKSTPSSEDSKADDHSSSSLKASDVEMETKATNESNNEDYVDDSLALIPVSMPLPEATMASDLKIVNKSVSEVLDALRHAREKIQSSMVRRHMIRVGPI